MLKAQRAFHRRPRIAHDERRHGERESHVPDVTFRWRREPTATRLPDRAPPTLP
jgi:hypothetical protein